MKELTVTLVLVHGVPETAAIWDDLRAELAVADVLALSPPGFGAPVPPGFGASADDYQAWLVEQLEQLDRPVDLFGHDWGGLHVLRLAAARPDLIRSWGSDAIGALDPSYVWHDLARTWQSRGPGEVAVTAMAGQPLPDREATFASLGMTPAAARSCAKASGDEMGRCILALYRSAVQPQLQHWGEQLEAAPRRPALVVNATADPYVGGAQTTHRSAKRFGAEEVVLDGLGHWWMMEDPVAGAAAIRQFLALG